MDRTLPWASPCLLAIMLFSNSIFSSAEESEWQYLGNENDIEIYSKPVEFSEYQAFKGTTVIPGSIASLLKVFEDPDICSQWIHGCESAAILDSDGFYQRNVYQINDFPWPAQDRDLVSEVTINEEKNTGLVTVQMQSRPKYIEETELVRIPHSVGVFQFKYIQGSVTEVSWEQHTEPGGVLPSWLVNQMIVEVPVNTLSHLKELVQMEPYASAALQRDDKGNITGWLDKEVKK